MQIKYGAGIVDGSGKLAGWVASRNMFGSYFRREVSPTNPQTPAQIDQRAAFTTVNHLFEGLTPQQEQAWNKFGKTYGSTTPFGEKKSIPGIAAFIRSNIWPYLFGDDAIENPPKNMNVPPVNVSSVAISDGTGLISVAFVPTPSDASVRILAYATPKVTGSKWNVNTAFRYVEESALAPASPATFTYPEDTLGGIEIGDRVGVKVKAYCKTNGAVSLVWKGFCIVVA